MARAAEPAGPPSPTSSVSVIIPVYNGERYLGDALESVLAQTVPPMEIVVVDDGSSDGSAAVAARFPGVRYVAQGHAGPGAARNRGVALARGAFVAFLDADDLWVRTKLARQVAAFQTDPALDMVFGHARQFHSPELVERTKARIAGAGAVLPGFVLGTLLVTRASFDRVGPFPTHTRVGEFLDWYARANDERLKSVLLPEVVLLRRLHTGNLGLRERDARADYVQILKASLDRRRRTD
ncbi:MAG TPA: glycosyltransferase family A protein [bacterium]|nr:glycosyltransferase family A protein [bacterium]